MVKKLLLMAMAVAISTAVCAQNELAQNVEGQDDGMSTAVKNTTSLSTDHVFSGAAFRPYGRSYGGYGSTHSVHFQGYVSLNCGFDRSPAAMLSLDANMGVRAKDYFYAGLGLSYDFAISSYSPGLAFEVGSGMSVFGEARGYYPITEGVAPYVQLQIGTFIQGIYSDYRPLPYYMMRIGAGFDFGRFSIGMGYQLWANSKYTYSAINMGYARIGIRVGPYTGK